MRKFVLLTLALLFIVVPQLNAEKNPFMAAGISLIFPGGGFTYLENGNEYKYDTQTFAYTFVELGLLNWAALELVNGEESNNSIIPLAMFVCVKVAEILDVYSETKEHNRKTESNYSFMPEIQHDKVNLSLTYRF